jgi:predicted permease
VSPFQRKGYHIIGSWISAGSAFCNRVVLAHGGEVIRDIRYAARIYRKSPGFALITTLLLALGIAANTIIFSAVDALLLRPLPVTRPEELVRLVQMHPGLGLRSAFSYPFYVAVKDRSETFAGILGQFEMNLALTDGAATERIRAHFVTGNFFSLLGVQAMYGWALTPDDERARSDMPPVVLGYPFWRRRFNADPAVIGRTILLQGHRCVIVGVAPKTFNGISVETSPDLRVPFTFRNTFSSSSDSEYNAVERVEYELAGRLRPGVTIGRAQSECSSLWEAIADPWGRKRTPGRGIVLQPMARGVSTLRAQFSNALVFLMTAACLLLLMVCANVAGLLMARSAARRQEIAIRVAVGASRGRLIRQMLTESALLTALAAAGGLLIAFTAMPFLDRALPPIRHLDATGLPLNIRIEPDLRILGFSLALCLLTDLLFGLGPALQAARSELYSSLKAVRSSRLWTGGQILVVVQVALCTFLLTVAGLLLSTFDRLRHLDSGFDQDRIITFSVDPTMGRYSPEQAIALELSLVERVRQLPGVDATAIAARGLMRGTGLKITVVLPGQKVDPADNINASTNVVSPEYFSTVGIRFVAGRNYRGTEPRDARPTPEVVNQAFARRFFPGLDPVGRLFGAKAEFQVIGVVSDAKYRSLREPVPPTVYRLLRPSADSFILHVRTRQRPESIISPVQTIMRGLDPQLPFYEIKTLAEEVQSSLWSERLVAALASLFAALAALLAAIGIYGLLSYTVAQRTREIGIRMALGARIWNILRLVSAQVIGMVASGIALGLAASVAAAPWIRHLLFGVSASDVRTLTATVLFVMLIAAAATALPAGRAVRIEPGVALRQEN